MLGAYLVVRHGQERGHKRCAEQATAPSSRLRAAVVAPARSSQVVAQAECDLVDQARIQALSSRLRAAIAAPARSTMYDLLDEAGIRAEQRGTSVVSEIKAAIIRKRKRKRLATTIAAWCGVAQSARTGGRSVDVSTVAPSERGQDNDDDDESL